MNEFPLNFHTALIFSIYSANIDDITGAQRVVLLTNSIDDNNQGSQNACNIKIKTGLQHSTPLISLVCDCNKIEIFTGIIEEYVNVYYGELLDEFDGTKSYIFEFKFPKNVTELLLKVNVLKFKKKNE